MICCEEDFISLLFIGELSSNMKKIWTFSCVDIMNDPYCMSTRDEWYRSSCTIKMQWAQKRGNKEGIRIFPHSEFWLWTLGTFSNPDTMGITKESYRWSQLHDQQNEGAAGVLHTDQKMPKWTQRCKPIGTQDESDWLTPIETMDEN